MSATAQAERDAGRHGLLRAGIVLTIAVGLANLLNAAFQLALARILEPDEYALLAALLAVVFVGAIPPLAFQATTARSIAADLAAGHVGVAGGRLRGTLRSVLAWSGVLLLATAVAVLVASVAGLGDAPAVGAAAATVAVALGIPVIWGGLQGAGRFTALSAAHLCLAGTRLAVGVAVALAGGDVAAVMLGVAAATVLTGVLTALPLRRFFGAATAVSRARLASRANVGAAVALTALWALAYDDLLAGGIAFTGGQAGAYAAASVTARVLLLVPIAATTVLFPRIATLRDARRERRYLLLGLSVVAAVSAVCVALLWVFSVTVIDVGFGSKYEDGAAWLGPLSLAMALYGLAIVYLYHFLALGRARFGAVLVLLLGAQIVAYGLFHNAPSDLVGIQIAFGATAAVAGELWYRLRIR